MSRKLLKLYLATVLMLSMVFISLEFWARQKSSDLEIYSRSVDELMFIMPSLDIFYRELDNQYLIHNVALFDQYPYPQKVTTGYVGTSRTKVIRPKQFAISKTVVGAGNTYNEITYGLLLQAEILRLQFPNLKEVYFEASLLLRRPARFILEEDHRKYLPLLHSLESLCKEGVCKQIFNDSKVNNENKSNYLFSLKHRNNFRLARLFGEHKEQLPVRSSKLFQELLPNGERKILSAPFLSETDWKPEVSNENIKVQRLRDIKSDFPWDGMFELIAEWGRTHNINVIFFQPPVRSDLYHFQQAYGLVEHVNEIERLALSYNVPFINLNKPDLGFMSNWAIFSDEDHMETCIGSGLLTLALKDGYLLYKATQELFPDVYSDKLYEKYKVQLAVCNHN